MCFGTLLLCPECGSHCSCCCCLYRLELCKYELVYSLLEHCIGCYGYKAELPTSTTVLIKCTLRPALVILDRKNCLIYFCACVIFIYNHWFVSVSTGRGRLVADMLFSSVLSSSKHQLAEAEALLSRHRKRSEEEHRTRSSDSEC